MAVFLFRETETKKEVKRKQTKDFPDICICGRIQKKEEGIGIKGHTEKEQDVTWISPASSIIIVGQIMRGTLTESDPQSREACNKQVLRIRPETGEEKELFGNAPGKRCMISEGDRKRCN